jgi:Family of unknown function (DUF6516)
MPYREETLLTLLAYDGLVYVLECQYWLKFSVREVEPSALVPHGVGYSFTLHSPDGERELGFDNAHPVPRLGNQLVNAPVASDHWHRDGTDSGRPYDFVSAEQLIIDFFSAVEKRLNELDLEFVVKDTRS